MLLGLVSAVVGGNTGSALELVADTDAMRPGSFSVIGEVNTGSTAVAVS